MAGQLLVRMYNVGLGDLIYLRIPDAGRDVHVLIDCGNKFGALDLLGQRIEELKPELPDDPEGGKRLDLLVVSHPHEDHHKGFEAKFFEDIKIKNLWLSPAFNLLNNPNAQGFVGLKEAAKRGVATALRSLPDNAFGEMKEELNEVLLSLSKKEAIDELNDNLPRRNGIKTDQKNDVVYATAQTPEAKLLTFKDPEIKLKVLGPVDDIDGYYVGGKGQLSPQKSGFQGMGDGYTGLFPDETAGPVKQPSNISSKDFRQLQSRIGGSALAAADLAGHVENNLSVVLLLEWHGKRLLFPGDAEWSGSYGARVERGRSNGSWNVMWQERKEDLSKPLDFLKIGHHGSENATPWAPPDKTTHKEHPISEILDALLPRPAAGALPTAMAIASTLRTSRWPSIPDPALMQEIGLRVANCTPTLTWKTPHRTHVPAGKPQPQRTDLEAQVTGVDVPFIEVRFPSE